MIIEWDPAQVGITAGDVYRQLLDGEPRIMSHATGDGYSFNVRPPSIRPGDQTLAGRRIAEVLRSAPKGIQKKTPAPASADVAGRWDVDVQYTRNGAAQTLSDHERQPRGRQPHRKTPAGQHHRYDRRRSRAAAQQPADRGTS